MTPELADLRDIHLPAPISWWPLAPGWWLILALLVVLALGVYLWRRGRARNRWRRYALAEVARLRAQLATGSDTAGSLIRELSMLLRRVAVSRFPREDVASLSGAAWLDFLDSNLGTTGFNSAHGQHLAAGPYMRDADLNTIDPQSLVALLDLSERWFQQLPGGAR